MSAECKHPRPSMVCGNPSEALIHDPESKYFEHFFTHDTTYTVLGEKSGWAKKRQILISLEDGEEGDEVVSILYWALVRYEASNTGDMERVRRREGIARIMAEKVAEAEPEAVEKFYD